MLIYLASKSRKKSCSMLAKYKLRIIPTIITIVNVRTIFGHIPTSEIVWTEICLTSRTSDGLGQIFFWNWHHYSVCNQVKYRSETRPPSPHARNFIKLKVSIRHLLPDRHVSALSAIHRNTNTTEDERTSLRYIHKDFTSVSHRSMSCFCSPGHMLAQSS